MGPYFTPKDHFRAGGNAGSATPLSSPPRRASARSGHEPPPRAEQNDRRMRRIGEALGDERDRLLGCDRPRLADALNPIPEQNPTFIEEQRAGAQGE